MATMTKERCLVKVSELMEQHRAAVLEQVEKYLRSGAINWQEYGDDYRLPKILTTAALRDQKDCFRPLHDHDADTVENLRHF